MMVSAVARARKTVLERESLVEYDVQGFALPGEIEKELLTRLMDEVRSTDFDAPIEGAATL